MREEMPDAPGIAYFRDGQMMWWTRLVWEEGTVNLDHVARTPRRTVEFVVEGDDE